MKIKLLVTGLVLSLAAVSVHARLGSTTTTPGYTISRPVISKPLQRDATMWNEFGIRYTVHNYEEAGSKPIKVTVKDLGPNFKFLKQDLAPTSGYVDVNGTQYNLIRNATNGNLSVTLPKNAFSGFGDSLMVTSFDRNGEQLGCFSFGFFF